MEHQSWLHFTRSRRCGGGMGAHLDAVEERGQTVVGLLDGPGGRGISVQRGAGRVQRSWKGRLEAAAVSVYHNGWGMDLMTPRDPTPVRVCWLHSDFPNLPILIRHCAPYADAFVSVHPCMQERIRREVSWLPEKRNLLGSCYLPLDPDSLARHAGPRTELVVGYLGRLEKTQKRIERLLSFCEIVADRGISLRLEIVGDGRSARWLERKLRVYPFVRFLGEQDKAAIPGHLARWKYIFFPSSFEGLPLALLEALAAGVVPIYPDFHEGRDPLGQPAPAGLYEQGEMLEAIRALMRLEDCYNEFYPDFRQRSLDLLQQHRPQRVAEQHQQLHTAFQRLRPRQKRQPSSFLTLPPIWYYNRIYRYLTVGAIY